MRKLYFLGFLAVLFVISSTSANAQDLIPADDCVRRLIAYDIQSRPVLSEVSIAFANGRASLHLFGSSDSRWSKSTRLAIQRGERLTSIVRRDRAVSYLIALEKRIRQIPLVTSVSWSADRPCTPGFICQSTGAYITVESVAPCSAYKNSASVSGGTGGLGVFKRPLDTLLPAKAGKFKLSQKGGGSFPGMRDLNATDVAGGIYTSTDKKALQITIINFADITGPDRAIKVIVTDDGRRPRNTVSDGPAKIKKGNVTGKYYVANFSADVAYTFWSNGSVLILVQGMDNTKRELNLKPATSADIKAFENALSY